MRSWPVALLVAVVSAACGIEGTATGGEAPAGELLDTGQVLYERHCAECHGVDLRGTDEGPSHLSILYEPSHHADGAFLSAVVRGVRAHHWDFGDMPPIEGLDVDEVAAITAYVRSVQQREGFEPYPP